MKTTWDLSKIYTPNTDENFEDELKQIEKSANQFSDKWNPKLENGYRDDYLNDPRVLKEALSEYEIWANDGGGMGDIEFYYHLATNLDQTDSNLKARENKLIEVGIRIGNNIQFFAIRLAKIDENIQKLFLESQLLKDYTHLLSKLFESAKHILTEPEEKILNLTSKVSHSNWVRMLSEQINKSERDVLDEKGNKAKKNFSEIMGLIDNPNKKIRDTAASALNDIFRTVIEIGEAEINTVIENKKVNDELRNYKRPDQARLLGDDIKIEIVDALRKVVNEYHDVSKEYYKLKAELLGQKTLQYHERNLSYGKVEKEYSFEETIELVRKVFTNLHPEFGKLFEEYLDGRIDAFPKKGKEDGAFCTPGYKSHKSHILLNHNNKLRNVLTLAHELGHGIHFEMMRKTQNSLNFGASMATAEVASTFMEDFVLQELSKEADDHLKLALSMEKLGDDISTIIRQIAFYDFELDIHTEFKNKGYLSKEAIGKLFKKRMESYMGDGVEQTEGSENWWVYVGHFRSFFYVYSYASGLLISKSLQNSVKQDPAFVEKVIKFFEAGESKSPCDIFLELGIDIRDKEFWRKGMNEVKGLLEETKALAKKLELI